MATTTLGNTSSAPTDRRSLYWGIIIAVVLALAVILTVRTTSMRDTVSAPIEASPTNFDVNRVPLQDVQDPINNPVNRPNTPTESAEPGQ